MKLEDLPEDDWNDRDLEESLESAYKNLLRLRKDHPTEVSYNTIEVKSPKSMEDRAKEIHRQDKSKSMQIVAIESYQMDLKLDDEAIKRLKSYW